jgi:hypothetical protein
MEYNVTIIISALRDFLLTCSNDLVVDSGG